MSDILYDPPRRLTVPTPVASIIRDYRRGILNRSNSGVRASIRLSVEEGDAIKQACDILGIDEYSVFMRWCATQSADKIIADYKSWEENRGT